MKKSLYKILTVALISSMMVAMTGCGNVFNKLFGVEDDNSSTGSNESKIGQEIDLSKEMTEEEEMELLNNGIEYDEEAEDANLHFRKSDEKEYYGTWSISSGNAIYMYGNLKITILPTGSWNGLIVDEKMSGKWTFDKNKMNLRSELFNATMAFTDKGVMVLQEERGTEDESDVVSVVMTRVED